MHKPLIFISHITSEKEIAIAFKQLVVEAFIGVVEVFVSSDPESISMGGKWLEEITDGLKRCAIEIVLASPQSVRRPWINFEAGAGWVRDIPVVPLCHSGMTPDSLPSPLNSLQGGIATDRDSMDRVFALLARNLDCRKPSVSVEEFVQRVKEFESISAQIQAASPGVDLQDRATLSEIEKATLIAIAEETDAPGAWVWPQRIANRMEQDEYRRVATNIGLESLKRRGMVLIEDRPTGNFGEETPEVCIHSNGWAWLHDNQTSVFMRGRYIVAFDRAPEPPGDDIPF